MKTYIFRIYGYDGMSIPIQGKDENDAIDNFNRLVEFEEEMEE